MMKSEQQPNAVSAKDAAEMLSQIRFSSISSLFKDPDFMMVTALAFAGFRVDFKSYLNPIVQKRLAGEASRNLLFAEKIQTLAEEAKKLAASENVRAASSLAPTAIKTPKSPDRPIRKLHPDHVDAEIARLKKELQEELQRRKSAESDLLQSRKESLAFHSTRAELEKDFERVQQKSERLERKLRRTEQAVAELRKIAAVSQSFEARQPATPPCPVEPTPCEEKEIAAQTREALDFVEAVRNLLDKPKSPASRQVCEETIRIAPENRIALGLHAQACERVGAVREASASLKSLLAIQIQRGEMEQAAETLVHLYRIAPDPKSGKEFFAATSAPNVCISSIRRVFEKVRGTDRESYKALRSLAQGDVLAMLFPPNTGRRPTPDSALPLSLPPKFASITTARQIVAEIDKNNEELVHAARAAMANLSDDEKQFAADAFQSLSEMADSYFLLLVRPSLSGPVVVDAMNVAWNGQEMLAHPHPRMSQIIAVRSALRLRCYFPIVLVSDANLQYVVDDGALALSMIASGQILLSNSGEDADHLVLREASRLGAPVVTNDYMADWDPHQKFTKIQYSIANTTGFATIFPA
jgi:tetratricopeptide (TPR) repeat protein